MENSLINNIKNKVVAHRHADGRVIIYIAMRTKKVVRTYEIQGDGTYIVKKSVGHNNNFDFAHNVRFRQMIYGCIFHSYNKDMDFTLALNSNWTLI